MVKREKKMAKNKPLVKVSNQKMNGNTEEDKFQNITNISNIHQQNLQIFQGEPTDQRMNEPFQITQNKKKKKPINKTQRQIKKNNEEYKLKDWPQRLKSKTKQFMNKICPPEPYSFNTIWRKEVAGIKKVNVKINGKTEQKEIDSNANRKNVEKLFKHEHVNPLLALQIVSGEFEKQIVSDSRKKSINQIGQHNTARGLFRMLSQYEWIIIVSSHLFKEHFNKSINQRIKIAIEMYEQQFPQVKTVNSQSNIERQVGAQDEIPEQQNQEAKENDKNSIDLSNIIANKTQIIDQSFEDLLYWNVGEENSKSLEFNSEFGYQN